FRARGTPLSFDAALLDLGRGGGKRGNPAIDGIGGDRSREGLDRAFAELAEERVVSASAGVLRAGLRQTLGVVLSHLAFPRRGFVGSEKRFVLQLPWAFERRDRGRVPHALETTVA